jgi:hypothetical protein
MSVSRAQEFHQSFFVVAIAFIYFVILWQMPRSSNSWFAGPH